MPKLDGLKEELNGLRIAISIVFALLVAITSGVIKRYDADKLDIFFWLGVIVFFTLLFSIPFFIKRIKSKTKEIKEL